MPRRRHGRSISRCMNVNVSTRTWKRIMEDEQPMQRSDLTYEALVEQTARLTLDAEVIEARVEALARSIIEKGPR